MGFMDLSGSLGRHFGSIGIALDDISTRIRLSSAPQLHFSGISSARAEKYAQRLCDALKVPNQLHIQIDSLIPEHIGLGSGTQMALAMGVALNSFYQLNLSVREIAKLSDRGARSGIGIGIFEKGGLVVDGGRGELTQTPPIISQLVLPAAWRFILVFDQRGQGLHGEQEKIAFKKLPPFSHHEAARLCYLLLMQGLPAVAEGDLAKFGDVISQLQQSVGEHFAAAQGGLFTSTEVGLAMDWLQQQGAVAIGQTSWGPTGFCAVATPEHATALLIELKQRFADFKNLSFAAVRAKNTGGEVTVVNTV